MNSSPPYRPSVSVARRFARRVRGHAAQDHVAGLVAVGVVDGLEEVDVDERDGERAVVAVGPLDLAEQGGEDGGPVRDPR